MKKFFSFGIFLSLLTAGGCKKEPPQTNPDPAQGSLQGADGQCLSKVTHGTWYNGLPAGTDTNYVDLNVYVTKPGTYKISSSMTNGVQFSATGTFTGIGMQTVRLKAIGSFVYAGTSNYPITFDSSSCPLHVSIEDSAGIGMDINTWQFTAKGHTYRGTASFPYFYQLPQNAGYSFEFTGTMLSGASDTVLQMNFYTQNIDTSAHLTSGTSVTGMRFYGNGHTIYYAGSTSIPAVIDIHLRSFTDNFLMGSFDGTARDSANNIVPITNAKFKL